MKKYIYALLYPLLAFCSCNKILDIKTPPNAIYPSTVFSDSSDLKSAVLGLYSQMETSQSYVFELTLLNSLYTDELTSASYPAYYDDALTSSDTYLSGIWADHYAEIYRANAIIQGLQRSTVLPTALRQQSMGEAYFIRALCYYMMVNLFNNIPLVTTTDVSANATSPQVSSDVIYQQIISDLQQAITYLPANYSISGNERTRANKLTAIALLAKVYLYTQDWTDADTEANLITSNSLFSLPSDLTTVFLNTSTEAIFQLNTKPTGYVPVAGYFVPAAGAMPGYVISAQLLNGFETGDKRKSSWIGISAGYAFPYKFKGTTTTTTHLEYNTILRLADIYLVQAEACAHENKFTQAQNEINAVRTRAGLANTTAGDQASLLLAIEQERKVEMFCEFGSRFMDLKRTGRIDAVLSADKSGWKSTDNNYPIPAIEISKNPNLKQNAGY